MPAYGFLFLIGPRKAYGVEMASLVHACKHLRVRVMLFSFEIKQSNCIRGAFILSANCSSRGLRGGEGGGVGGKKRQLEETTKKSM